MRKDEDPFRIDSGRHLYGDVGGSPSDDQVVAVVDPLLNGFPGVLRVLAAIVVAVAGVVDVYGDVGE